MPLTMADSRLRVGTRSGPPVPQSAARPFFGDLEGLRGLAIVLVLAAHAHLPFASFGLYGVDVFFVLSGFLITSGLRRTFLAAAPGTYLRAYSTFLQRRSFRLVPAYLVVFIALVVWTLVLHVPGGLRCATLTATYTMNLPLLDAGHCAGPWHVMWSLAAEQQFYLLWPILICLTATWLRAGVAWLIAGLFACTAVLATALALSVPGAAGWLNYSPLGRPTGLLVGAFVALVVGAVSSRALHPGVAGWAVLACLILIEVLNQLDLAPPQVVLGLPVAVACGWLVWSLRQRPGTWLSRALAARPLTFLGRISYSLYLIHILALYIARTLLPEPLAGVTGVLVALALAIACQRFVEDPCRRRGNHWLDGRVPASAT